MEELSWCLKSCPKWAPYQVGNQCKTSVASNLIQRFKRYEYVSECSGPGLYFVPDLNTCYTACPPPYLYHRAGDEHTCYSSCAQSLWENYRYDDEFTCYDGCEASGYEYTVYGKTSVCYDQCPGNYPHYKAGEKTCYTSCRASGYKYFAYNAPLVCYSSPPDGFPRCAEHGVADRTCTHGSRLYGFDYECYAECPYETEVDGMCTIPDSALRPRCPTSSP